MNNIKDALIRYGLSEKESLIYLFLLGNRDVPAHKVSLETEIPRTTVYEVLDNLKKQGIVSSWIKNGVKHFSAESPEILKRLIKSKEESIQSVFGEMTHMFNMDAIYPSTKLYQGKEGVKQVFENILDVIKHQKLKRLYVFSDYHLTEQFPKYFSDWRKRKNKTGAYTFLIVPPGTPMNENYSSNEFRETKFMPSNFPFEGSVDICGTHLAFFSFKNNEVYAITIDSPIISEMLTKFFLYIWDTLPRINDN